MPRFTRRSRMWRSKVFEQRIAQAVSKANTYIKDREDRDQGLRSHGRINADSMKAASQILAQLVAGMMAAVHAARPLLAPGPRLRRHATTTKNRRGPWQPGRTKLTTTFGRYRDQFLGTWLPRLRQRLPPLQARRL